VIADGLVGCFRQPRNIEILLAGFHMAGDLHVALGEKVQIVFGCLAHDYLTNIGAGG
jgi:hypothetical protein